MPTLNVILHGLFALARRKDHIVALAPEVKGQHVYRAGSWLGEIELRPGFYSLMGVNPAAGVFEPAKNLILKGRHMSPQAPQRAHAAIWFPRPKEIHSLRTVTIDPEDLDGKDADSVDSSELATIQVFVYDCADLTNVSLQGHLFKPSKNALSPMNLHIFAEEDAPLDVSSHAADAFDEAMLLFDDVDLRLVNSKTIPPADPKEVRPPGIALLEFEDLGHRQGRHAFLGETLRQILSSDVPDYCILKGVFTSPRGAELPSCSFPVVDEEPNVP